MRNSVELSSSLNTQFENSLVQEPFQNQLENERESSHVGVGTITESCSSSGLPIITQRLHDPVIKEYTLNYNRIPNMM